MGMNLVSVIVPIYKVESYLPECLDSILSSTYTELEIILVDDGSPDNCPAICDEYAQRDSRIKVLHQENQGLVAARNAGLNAASGIYVSFVDSDDAISPLMYEKMVSAIERTDADMAASGYCIDRAQLVTQIEQQEGEDHCLTTFDQQLAMLTIAPSVRGFTWTSCYVWNKLYRRAKIRSAFQPECSMCEDLEFNWKYIHSCKKIVLVQHALYMYRMNQQGITGKYKAQRRNPAMIVNSIANAKMWAMIAQNSDIHDAALQNYLDGRSAYVAHLCYKERTELQGVLHGSTHAVEETLRAYAAGSGNLFLPSAYDVWALQILLSNLEAAVQNLWKTMNLKKCAF